MDNPRSGMAGMASIEAPERGGSIPLILVIAGILVGIAVAIAFVTNDVARHLIVGLLAFLAAVGIAALFAMAIGVLRVSSKAQRNDLTKAIVDSAGEGLIIVEENGRVAYANEAYLRLSGPASSTDAVKPVERLFAGSADVSEAIYRLAQAVREGKAVSEEIRLSPPLAGDADVAWYRVRVRPLPRGQNGATNGGRSGGRVAYLWSVADITRERERQENVFQELQQAIDYLDHAPAGFFSAEPSGAIVHINATLAGWLDHDLASFSPGRLTLSDIVIGNGATLLMGSRGLAGEVRTDSFDLDLRRRGGKTLPARILNRVSFGADGLPGASRALVISRAPGEEPVEDLRAAEVRFARFFNNTPMAIATLNEAGALARMNASFVRLFADSEGVAAMRDRSLSTLIRAEDWPDVRDAIASAGKGRGDIAPIDVQLTGPVQRTARLFISSVQDSGDRDPGIQDNGLQASGVPGSGSQTGKAQDGPANEGSKAAIVPGAAHETAIVYALETSELRALEVQFAQAQKMQAVGQLAGGIAHDFNNVLQAIIGYSDLLLANHRPTDPAFHDINQIKQNANRAADLVRQLLAFARKQTLQPKTVALGDVLSDLQMLLKRLLGEKTVLDLRHGRDLWFVRADRGQLTQVLINLAVNARDAMEGGGTLSIRTANAPESAIDPARTKGMPAADYVQLEVSDTGSGIPPEVIGKIFEPFFSTKEVGKGTGLGLSTVYGIVKQSGGFIYCDSTPGKGTSFRIFLPRVEPDIEEVAEPVAKGPARDMTGSGTILLVEDEEAVRAFAARALSSRGYTVLTAMSGVDGLRVAGEHVGPIDLVLSDVVMPEMDGPTMMRELRATREGFKAVFMSGHAEDAFEKSLDPAETFGFISKPFSLKDLVEIVKTTLAS